MHLQERKSDELRNGKRSTDSVRNATNIGVEKVQIFGTNTKPQKPSQWQVSPDGEMASALEARGASWGRVGNAA